MQGPSRPTWSQVGWPPVCTSRVPASRRVTRRRPRPALLAGPAAGRVDRLLRGAARGRPRKVTWLRSRSGALAAWGGWPRPGSSSRWGTPRRRTTGAGGPRRGAPAGHPPVQRDAGLHHREPGPTMALLDHPGPASSSSLTGSTCTRPCSGSPRAGRDSRWSPTPWPPPQARTATTGPSAGWPSPSATAWPGSPSGAIAGSTATLAAVAAATPSSDGRRTAARRAARPSPRRRPRCSGWPGSAHLAPGLVRRPGRALRRPRGPTASCAGRPGSPYE